MLIGHLGHFLLDFFGQTWSQWTLRHILGPIMVIFGISFFDDSENGYSQKIKDFLMKDG